MRTPSIKTIQLLTRANGDAKLVKRALTMDAYEIISEQWGDTFPHTMKWVRSCWVRTAWNGCAVTINLGD